MNYEAIVAALPGLSQEQLRQLSQRLQVLLMLDHSPASHDEVFVLQRLAEVMASLGVEKPHPGVLRRYVNADFRRKLGPLLEFLEQAHPQRIGQLALLELAFRLLHQKLERLGYEVSARSMLAQIDRLPGLLNQAFPGYSSAGLLRWVVDEVKCR